MHNKMIKIVKQEMFKDGNNFIFRFEDEQGQIVWTNKFFVPFEREDVQKSLEEEYQIKYK